MADAQENILGSVKESLGIPNEVTNFDVTLLMHISTALATVLELGVGDPEALPITKDTPWTDFVEDSPELDMVRSYVCLKVRVLFDPPSLSFVLESYSKQITELEWRLNASVDPDTTET